MRIRSAKIPLLTAFEWVSSRWLWYLRLAISSIALSNGVAVMAVKDTLVDEGATPFDNMMQTELRARIERELRQVPEPYRTTVILRELEGLSYEEIAEVMQTSLGTVKSRLMRGREALKRCLEPYIRQASQGYADASAPRLPHCGREVEVTP